MKISFKVLMRRYVYGGLNNIDMRPIYISELGGEVLNIADRLEMPFIRKVEKDWFILE